MECDVTDEEAAHDLIRHARDELGGVDILVNNAGVMLLSKIEKGLSDQWRQMFDVTRRFRGTKPRELRFHARLSANGAQQFEIAGA